LLVSVKQMELVSFIENALRAGRAA